MAGLVFSFSPNHPALSKRPDPPFDRPLLDTQRFRKTFRRHKRIGLHVPKYLKRQRIKGVPYTDTRHSRFGIYTDRLSSNPQVFVRFFSKS